eukprot:scaffold65876_cov39-Phaeocystis_antarctica.AAC.1
MHGFASWPHSVRQAASVLCRIQPVGYSRSVRLRAAGTRVFVQGGAALDPQAARRAAGPTGRRLRRARLPPLPARGRRHTGRSARAGDRLIARRCGAAAAARGQGVMGGADC